MKLSLNWLRDYLDLDLPVDQLCAKLTMLGLEIEAVEQPGAEIQQVFIGEILTMAPHPDADKLSVCTTRINDGQPGDAQPLQIVCGAHNMKPGDRVPTVIVGGQLPGGFAIAKRKMRGIESQGMMCSPRELGLGQDHDGLMILSPDAPIGADVKAYLGLDDTILEIEVTPNRGDWACMLGVARELAAAYSLTHREPVNRDTGFQPVINRGTGFQPVSALSSVTIESPDLCPRYIGRVIQHVKIGPSPDWLVRRLAAAGQRSINNVVDVTNYVMLETGQPLHAFDFDKLAERRIVVRQARPGETIKTIDQSVRPLTPDMLVIADAQQPVALAGVMGGFDTEVGETTANIFLESAYFHPPSIRKTSRALGLSTESSQRFQRGADPERALYAAHRAAQLIQEVAGGEIAQGVLDAYPKPLRQNEINLRFARTNALLGTTIDPTEQSAILTRLGFEQISRNDSAATFRVPPWRHDASLEADLIEEIARLHGYDEIASALPRVRHTENVLAPDYARQEQLRNKLVSLGLVETVIWSFSAKQFVERARLDGPYLDMIEVANPLTENHATMRSTLLPGLFQTASANIRRNRPDIAIFELGPIYRPAKKSENLPAQSPNLGIVLSGLTAAKHWSLPERPFDFYDLKGYAEEVLKFFGLTDAQFLTGGPQVYAEGQSAQIVLGDRPIGHLGQVDPAVAANFEIDKPIFALELELELLFRRKPATPKFAPMPAYPPALRDLAVVVDREAPAGELCAAAMKSGGKHLRNVSLFDIYTGKQVPPGKKSVALSLAFQSDERTLTDEDTQKAWEKILRTLEKQFGAELR